MVLVRRRKRKVVMAGRLTLDKGKELEPLSPQTGLKMQITLTPADIVLELFIGLAAISIAAIAAIVSRRWSYWFSKLLTWSASRSKKSAAKRADRLRNKLKAIEELRNDPLRYVGLMAQLNSNVVFYLVMSTTGMVCGIVYTAAIRIVEPGASKTFGWTIVLASLAVLLSTMFDIVRLSTYSNITKYEKGVQKQLAKLNERWGV
jgi:hypothetical protein